MHRVILLLIAALWLTPLTVAEPAVTADSRAQAAEELTLRGFRSRHYVIYTNLTREETQPYGRHMDKVADQYHRRFAQFVPRDGNPMPLYLLKTREQYVRFLASHNIDATNSGGMFFVTHSAQGLATWAEASNRQKTYRVLQHEGFHQFAWTRIGSKLPTWANEGLAQYFEDAVMIDGAMQLGLAHQVRIGCVQDAIDRRQGLSLAELMHVIPEDWAKSLRQDRDASALLYAQSWSVVYFLIHHNQGQHKEKLLDYLKLINRGSTPEQAELLSFGTAGIASLEKQWRDFASTQRPDDLSLAMDRLEFLGTGLRLLNEHDRDMPTSIDNLQSELQRFGFKLRRHDMGLSRDQSAEDQALFSFVRGSESGKGFTAQFKLLAPSRRDLPPRIVAPGLSPEPTLVWYRDSEGNLVQDIEYR